MLKLICLFVFPFLASLFAFVFPEILSRKQMRRGALFLSIIPLLLLLFFGFDGWIGQQVKASWITPLAISFNLKVDALALLFLYLTAIIIPIAICATRVETLDSPRAFYGLIFLLQGLLGGFFTAHDLVLFVIFWEAMLFPIYFIITLWGNKEARKAALQFLLYMIAGSSLLIISLLGLYAASASSGNGTFDLESLQTAAMQAPYAKWICAIFLLAFAVKTPLFPFHAWLPETYYQASTTGTILLSALLSKAGIFGFLRIGWGLFPNLMHEWGGFLLAWAIAGVLYGALAAWMQKDYKRLIAYCSFSHVNFILAGLFVWNLTAHQGAILQALNHGITIAGLFLATGWLEEKIRTTTLGSFSGVAKFLPQLCWLTMIFVLSSVAIPGTNNFIGELLVLLGLFAQHPWLTALLGSTIILSVIYMLKWMQQLYFCHPVAPIDTLPSDIGRREFFIALPLLLFIFWIGIYPASVLKKVDLAAVQIVKLSNSKTLEEK